VEGIEELQQQQQQHPTKIHTIQIYALSSDGAMARYQLHFDLLRTYSATGYVQKQHKTD